MRITVYNFEIEGAHTYFVAGDAGSTDIAIWVHNACFFRAFRDGLGRIKRVFAVVDPGELIIPGARVSRAARNYVREVGAALDDAGHIIARRFGPAGEALQNYFAQNRTINRGAYRAFENQIANYIQQRQVVAGIEVGFKYAGESLRAIGVEYIVSFSDGYILREVFDNPILIP